MKSLYKTHIRDSNQELKKIFENCSFVGVVDPGKILIQFDVNLLLLNLEDISQDLFYQIVLKDYGNFESYEFEEPVSIRRVLGLTGISELRVNEFMASMIEMKEMLRDYFSICIGRRYKLV